MSVIEGQRGFNQGSLILEEDDEDTQDDIAGDETKMFLKSNIRHALTIKGGVRKFLPLTGMRTKFSSHREQKFKPQAPHK